MHRILMIVHPWLKVYPSSENVEFKENSCIEKA